MEQLSSPDQVQLPTNSNQKLNAVKSESTFPFPFLFPCSPSQETKNQSQVTSTSTARQVWGSTPNGRQSLPVGNKPMNSQNYQHHSPPTNDACILFHIIHQLSQSEQFVERRTIDHILYYLSTLRLLLLSRLYLLHLCPHLLQCLLLYFFFHFLLLNRNIWRLYFLRQHHISWTIHHMLIKEYISS